MCEPTRNSKLLESFAAYCKANPDQRFWQPLRNWSDYNYVWVSNTFAFDPIRPVDPLDTFYWEHKSE